MRMVGEEGGRCFPVEMMELYPGEEVELIEEAGVLSNAHSNKLIGGQLRQITSKELIFIRE
jgi:hypothetical protein